MVTIRKGVMKDCKDLLTVYQGTHWADGYKTVEQVKAVHRGVTFVKWGWLVAEMKGSIVGEAIFRVEKNPLAGRIGIIKDIGVDVRYQKRKIGTKLTKATEKVLREKRAVRVLATSPPEAYNYWMKVKYFARGKIFKVEIPPSKIPQKKSTKVKTNRLSDITKIPKSMKFSHLAYPGALADMISEIVDRGTKGQLLEYHEKDRLIGVGAVVVDDDKTARFVADVPKGCEDYSELVIVRTARASSRWKATSVSSIVSKDQLVLYTGFAPWSYVQEREIPVTRLL